ncbi:YihY family inner membrane protein [Nostocoides sp. F2B08]|uniref:YihY/virulence factor BrkB family protein n=1 Tax=Nostocoides sp. F2B08 TaxID=2653936 RepID=UPI001262C71E|nr:YihY/virulence factor BrkB family protein [Tetrasphaera sp. F2B08]KAB7745110.1 YihY family inner membrane protein [Tetrasphaera sp. F2B08]
MEDPVAREGESTVKAQTAPEPDERRKPENPTDLDKPPITLAIKGAVQEFVRDQVTDLAAALTYYSVLSIFPAMLALISLLGVVGESEATAEAVIDLLRQAGQDQAAELLADPIRNMAESQAAGWTLAFGLALALYAASNYVNAFGRAMNRIYQIDEGRPFWKLRPQMLAVTIILVLIAAIIMLGLVLSGEVAATIGSLVGLADESVQIWNIAKWPVILVLVVLAVAILYYATPNIQQPRFRWISLGAFVAITVWIIATLGFGFYVSSFGNYQRTYGSLAGVIVFLLWLWLTNLALLFGAEVDAEVERSRQLQAGIKAEETLQLPPRDTSNSEKAAERLQDRVEEGRRIRMAAREQGASGHRARAAGTGDRPSDGRAVEDQEHRVGASADPAYGPGSRVELEPLPSERARSR